MGGQCKGTEKKYIMMEFDIQEYLKQASFFTVFFYLASKWISPILEFRKKSLSLEGKSLSLERKKCGKLSGFYLIFLKIAGFFLV